MASSAAPPQTASRVVLDTNVVLDWLLFDDPAARPLAAAIEAGGLHWHATPPMRDEIQHVLRRPELLSRDSDSERILTVFDSLAVISDASEADGAALHLRCRDADDQMFIDLACAIGARWLVSRDRALLALARRAVITGLEILRPADWARRHGEAVAA
jgi:putative PIN family toxin of toxin-antitoxin system